jgi:hypothetical protein
MRARKPSGMALSLERICREEFRRAFVPLQGRVARLQRYVGVLEQLAQLGRALAPAEAPSPRLAAKRKPVREKLSVQVVPSAVQTPAVNARGRVAPSCSIIGCGKKRYAAGFCASDYAIFVQMERDGVRPAAWMPHARSNSIPRG